MVLRSAQAGVCNPKTLALALTLTLTLTLTRSRAALVAFFASARTEVCTTLLDGRRETPWPSAACPTALGLAPYIHVQEEGRLLETPRKVIKKYIGQLKLHYIV